jgi:hypothetical protein
VDRGVFGKLSKEEMRTYKKPMNYSTTSHLPTVTLWKREHKVAFTKGVSKFHQFIEADETSLHVYRVLWRYKRSGRHVHNNMSQP